MIRQQIAAAGFTLILIGLGARYLLDARAAPTSTIVRIPVAIGTPVKISVANGEDVDVSLSAVAHVEAWSSVAVRARVSGQLQALSFTPGAKVKQGDLLAQIDPQPLQAQLEQMRGNLGSAQAQLGKAEADLSRYDQVLSKGFVSRADYDTYKANVALAHAAVQSSQAALSAAQLQLGYTRIKAPFDGTIGSPMVYPGAQVAGGTTDIATLNEIRPIHIVFHVPESALDSILELQTHGPIAVTARASNSSAAFDGTLDFIDNAVDHTTGTVTLKARFDNDNGFLIPGQFVEATMPVRHLANAVTIDAEALQSSDKGNFVFVVDTEDKAHQRYVTTGATVTNRIVVDTGLKPGEKVVIDGQLALVDGSAVRVVADKSKTAR